MLLILLLQGVLYLFNRILIMSSCIFIFFEKKVLSRFLFQNK